MMDESHMLEQVRAIVLRTETAVKADGRADLGTMGIRQDGYEKIRDFLVDKGYVTREQLAAPGVYRG